MLKATIAVAAGLAAVALAFDAAPREADREIRVISPPTVTARLRPSYVEPEALAMFPLTRKNWPELFRTLGAAKVDRLAMLAYSAAFEVAERPGCDSVEIVGVSSKTTATRGVVYVDCRNGSRYIRETIF